MYAAMYVVMLAPVGALPFLFGAESATVVADRLADAMGALTP